MKASSRPPFSIRECRPEDLDQIIEIEREAFPDPYDRFTFTQLLMAEPKGFLVAEADHIVLGYITAATQDRCGMIYSIAVSKTHTHKGIGKRLMEAELEYLSPRADTVQLQVGVNNSAAKSLYASFSFVELGRIRRYYPNGEDAILMELDLGSQADIRRQ